jgi:hypothetical protein
VSGTYAETMHIVIDYANGLSADERQAILGESGARFYGVRQEP